MRLLLRITVLIAALQIIAVVGARWWGHQQHADRFPVPADDGCWQNVCFLDLALDTVTDTLKAQRDVLASSVRLMDEQFPSAYGGTQIEFTYAPAPSRMIPVVLFWTAHIYSLELDQMPDRSPLRLGDIIMELGPPPQVILLRSRILLHYPNRSLTIHIRPARMGHDWARITPDLPVVGISVATSPISNYSTTRYATDARLWQGFHLYRFAS